ncbi:hypothetical protein [Nonomuraea helvata]|uniref:Uncharacterized protein n=1 Tax=Nonomuraea helvata TaxID=37484 RepID=A0ABV5S7H2_9ACTN
MTLRHLRRGRVAGPRRWWAEGRLGPWQVQVLLETAGGDVR